MSRTSIGIGGRSSGSGSSGSSGSGGRGSSSSSSSSSASSSSPQATSPSSETHACLGLRLLAGSSCREHTVTRASMLRP